MKFKIKLDEEFYDSEVIELTETSAIVEVAGDLFEVELPDGDVFALFNPYHDELGRFASKAATVGAVTSIAGYATLFTSATANAIANTVVENRVSRGRKRSDVLQDKVIDTTIAGKKLSVSYKQLLKGTEKAAIIGASAGVGGFVVNMAGDFIATKRHNDWWRERQKQQSKDYDDWQRNRTNNQKQTGRQSWPKGATEQDFKKMYRDLSKKWHPDISKAPNATQMQQKINDLFDKKDYQGIKDLYTQLEQFIESILLQEEVVLPEEFIGVLANLLRVIKEALDDGSDFIIFPGDDVPEPFVKTEEGLTLDKFTAQLIIDTFYPEQTVKNEINFEDFLCTL